MVKIFLFVYSIHGGGAERVACTLQNKLPSSLSRELVVFYHENIVSYQILGTTYTIMNYGYEKNIASKFFINIIGFVRYVKHLCKQKPAIVISFLPWENVLNLLSSLFISVVPVISVHISPNYFSGYSKFWLKFTGYLVRVIPKAKVIAVSKDVMEQFSRICNVPSSKINILYNPIDVESIQSLAKSNEYDFNLFLDSCPVIITAGRFDRNKAQHHLIRAFAMLRRDRPARLLICGIGSEETYLKALAKDLGVEEGVIFLGWQENPYKYMAHSTMFVLSSLSESFGNVLVEAMASGCPVISANCSSGVREIIGEHNEYGLLAEPMTGIRHRFDDPLDFGEKSLLDLMLKLIDDGELREKYIENGKKRAKYFSVEKRVTEYEQFIQRVLVDS